jgi:hypothetical protein
MNETSIVARSGGNGRSAGLRSRALVRSITSTLVLGYQLARLGRKRPVMPDPHAPGAHRLSGTGPRRSQPALGEQGVDSAPGHAEKVPAA